MIYLVLAWAVCTVVAVAVVVNCQKEQCQTGSEKSQNSIMLINKDKLKKECPIGFSWTVFFFGPIVPLRRGDLKWFLIMLFLNATVVGILANFLWFSKNYNKFYIQDWLEKGYKPYDEKAVDALKEMGIHYGE